MAYRTETEQRDPVEILGEEFLSRRRSGEQVSVEEYAATHPALANEIRLLFRTMIAMERFKTCTLSATGPSVPMEIEGLQQLGDYRIVSEIGRGAMGVVYEAEQQSLRRRVAVKVFPHQALRKSHQLERFHLEAQTAARLHHTNIVPVFGVGEQDGLHYFVMQRIDGMSLDGFVDGTLRGTDLASAALQDTRDALMASARTINTRVITKQQQSPRQRNDLEPDDQHAPKRKSGNNVPTSRTSCRWVANVGIQVADAIAYAHSQGVLHRDIKPSNRLQDVTETIWVTDFGLATALNTEEASEGDEIAGTLRYMAPEHLRGQLDSLGDIYSLGLTLYELLVMRPAFLEQSRARMIDRIIKGDLASPRTFRPDIPRDLESIVMKAVSREPKERYETADAMATDLRRFLQGRPVSARPIGALEGIFRWTRRNPVVASLTAALLVGAVFSFAVISSKWREAVAENHRAEANLSLALESMDQILERFASGWMARPSATESDGEPTAYDVEVQIAVSDHSAAVLQNALKFYDQFAAQNETNSDLQRETATVHRRVADIYLRLGQYSSAERAYKRSLETLDSAQEAISDEAYAVERASTVNQLGLAMFATSRFEEAKTEFLRAKDTLIHAASINHPRCQAELARTHNNLGHALWHARRRGAAKHSQRQAVDILEGLVADNPTDTEYRLALAHAYRSYYPYIAWGSQNVNHEQIRAAGIEILEKLVNEFPNVPDYSCELSEMLAATSFCHHDESKRKEQTRRLERAVHLAQQLTTDHPSIPRYRALLARTLKELAGTQRVTDRIHASNTYQEAASIYRSLARDFADIPVYHLFLSLALKDQAENLRKLSRAAESRAAIEEAIVAQDAYVQLRPESTFGKGMLARLYEDLADALTSLDQAEGAKQARAKAWQLRHS